MTGSPTCHTDCYPRTCRCLLPLYPCVPGSFLRFRGLRLCTTAYTLPLRSSAFYYTRSPHLRFAVAAPHTGSLIVSHAARAGDCLRLPAYYGSGSMPAMPLRSFYLPATVNTVLPYGP